MEDLRAGLDNLDSGCGYVHHNVTLKSSDLRFSGCGGHPICCEFPTCSSPLRVIRSAAPHYPVLRGFLWRLYAAYKKHKDIKAIDGMLSSGSVEELIEYLGLQEDLPKLFSEDGEEHAVVSEDHSSPGLGCIETHLRVTHDDLIAELQSKFQDDAEFPCYVAFGEFHPRDKHVSASEYAKSRLLNKDPRFRKDPQYVFFLLWQQEMRQISGIYNVLKSTGKGKMPVRELLAGVSKSDENIEANLSTIFQSVRGTKQFGFPRDCTDIAVLNPVEECLKSRKKIYCLPRSVQECRVNDYNPLILLLWKANMDIQFTAESSLTLAHYVTGYVTKAEKSNMQDVWQEVNANSSIYSKLWSFGIRSLCSRECGLYEASDLLLGDHLTEKSVTVKWIDVAMPHKRKRRLKSHTQLVEMEKNNPGSTDILEGSVVDIYYPTRPEELENVCLYDFVKWYAYSGTRDNGTRVYQKLQKPILPNHKLFDPSIENQREDYYYSLMLLFIPFRDEGNLTAENETAELAFNRFIVENADLSKHHEKLQALLKAQTAGESKAAMEDVFHLNEGKSGTETVEDRVAKLNGDQLRVFKNVIDHLSHQKHHENGQCSCTNITPLCMFMSGVGGTGKSFLIHTIRAMVNDMWKDKPESVRLFQLPIEHDSKTFTYWALPKESLKVMRNGCKHLKLIIIDEVSMLSSLSLAYIHLRLEELFGGDQWFGSMNILFVGDILQLPPVNGSMVFQNVSNKVIATRLGCMASVNIWRETVVYDELTINERQKRDPEFGELLNEVRVNCVSDKSVAQLHKAVITCTAVEKFQELLGQGLSPVCLFATRKSCDQFNTDMLSKVGSEVARLPCIDEFDETAGTVKWTKRASSELERLNKDCNMTAGLEAELNLAVGARVMLRRNIDTSQGLVNGALGSVTTISKECIQVTFDHTPKVPFKIERVRSRFQILRRFYVYRKQFPLILAFAVTINKCQGLSLDCAIVDLSSSVFATGMAYVAISRVRTLAGLHLLAFDPKSIKVSDECVQEVNRLRKLFRPDLTSIPLSKECKAVQHKISALPLVHTTDPVVQHPKRASVKHSAGTKKQKTVDITVVKPITMTCSQISASNLNGKKVDSPIEESKAEKKFHSNSNSSVIDLTKGNDVPAVARVAPRITWPEYRYYQTDDQWQREKCRQLNLVFASPHDFVEPGGPNVVLRRPNLRTVVKGVGDGNCLF
eukprot:Em0015g399a